MIEVFPVILCGGYGSRLWPLSRSKHPKQFLSFFDNSLSLFQETIRRTQLLSSSEVCIKKFIIVANEEHRFVVMDQLKNIPNDEFDLILEPSSKNTAPSLTLAALNVNINHSNSNSIMIVIPSDHMVLDEIKFCEILHKAIKVALNGNIAILGVKLDKPQTGYGYIQSEGPFGDFSEKNVKNFIEKPKIKQATEYSKADEYSCNAGIFILSSNVWLNALKKFREDILDACVKSFSNRVIDNYFIRPDKNLFESIPAESIDYAVMERCKDSQVNLKILTLNAGWNDLGTYMTLWETSQKDKNGNYLKGDIFLEESNNNYIYSDKNLICTIGINNLVIAATSNAILVSDINKSQEVKKIVTRLAQEEKEEASFNSKVFRPWGWFDLIEVGENFKIKRIMVNPGASLSLQSHNQRSEHWVVLKGEATILCNDLNFTLKENESTFIPLQAKHRLSNKNEIPLEIIEIQAGSYLGEDDIVRYDDIYGRIEGEV